MILLYLPPPVPPPRSSPVGRQNITCLFPVENLGGEREGLHYLSRSLLSIVHRLPASHCGCWDRSGADRRGSCPCGSCGSRGQVQRVATIGAGWGHSLRRSLSQRVRVTSAWAAPTALCPRRWTSSTRATASSAACETAPPTCSRPSPGARPAAPPERACRSWAGACRSAPRWAASRGARGQWGPGPALGGALGPEEALPTSL